MYPICILNKQKTKSRQRFQHLEPISYLDVLNYSRSTDDLRCGLGTKNCTSATRFRHTAADSVVGFDIFMYGNCVSNQQIEP